MNWKDVLTFVLIATLWVLPLLGFLYFFFLFCAWNDYVSGLALLMMLVALFLSLLFVPIAKIFARLFNVLDVPDGKIKVHSSAVPYLGGIAVFFGFLISFGCVIILGLNEKDTFVWGFIGCALLLILGLIDDILVITPRQKFLGQCLAAVSFIYGGFYLSIGGNIYLGMALSALWILTIINAFNLIDVMDGLATTVAALAAFGFMALAWYLAQYSLMFIFACFTGSLLGFLVYNVPPASIYLGDAGSLWIGGLLAAFPLKMNFNINTHAGYLVPIIILAIPLLELISLIVIRAYKKIPFYRGSPDHFSIYLRQHGWSKSLILFYISCMMIACISAAYGLVAGFINLYQIIIIAIIFLIVWFIFLIYGSLRPQKI
jgi:UDP-GlcNAc:undecaprenyl-phosphate GlcNAc-1-phosphate transferase